MHISQLHSPLRFVICGLLGTYAFQVIQLRLQVEQVCVASTCLPTGFPDETGPGNDLPSCYCKEGYGGQLIRQRRSSN